MPELSSSRHRWSVLFNRDRLTSSNGKFDYETWNPFWNKWVNTYSIDFEYNITGKILRKNQENKLKKTTDSPRTPGGGKDVSKVTTYGYGADGMRVLKKGKYGTVQYVSENYVVRNKCSVMVFT